MLRDRRGVAALEFALAAVVLMSLLCGLIDAGWQVSTEMALEHGAHDAVRFAVTGSAAVSGQDGAPSCRAQTIAWLVTAEAPNLLTTQDLQVLTSADGGQTSQSAGQSGFGGTASSTVQYTFIYNQPFLTPLGQALFGEASFIHRVQLLAQNEAFPTPGC